MVPLSEMPKVIGPMIPGYRIVWDIYSAIKGFVLSQKFVWLMVLSCYIDVPHYMWNPFVDFWKRILKQPFISVYFRDTSKKLSTRFFEKKQRKAYTIYVILIELYVIHVDIWRKFVVYWESERWIMCFITISLAVYATYRLSIGHIYFIKHIDILKQESEYAWWNERKKIGRWRRARFFKRLSKRYKEYILVYEPWTARYNQRKTRAYEDLWEFRNAYNYEYFFSYYKIGTKGFIRFLYIWITIGYLGMLWHYDFYLHKHIVEVFYSGFEDNIFLHDPNDDDTRLGLDYWWLYRFNRVASWWHLIILQIDFPKFYVLAHQIHGNWWFLNSNIIYWQNVRKMYWLKYEKRLVDLKKYGYPQLYHFEPTIMEINDHIDKENYEYEVLQKKIEKRKLKNHWFIKKIKNFWKKKQCLIQLITVT